MKVVYLSNSIGKKSNGGSSLSGLRFLELLESKFGQVTLVTDEWRSPPSSTAQRTVELAAVDLVRHGWSFRQIVKLFIFTFVNLARKKTIDINADNQDVLLVVNSFTTLVGKVNIKTTGTITRVCVVRGDTTSFIYQSWGGPTTDPLEVPKRFLKIFDAIIYVSKTICNNWINCGVDNMHWYLPNSIDEAEVSRVKTSSVTETRLRLGMSSDKFHIVVVGSVQKRKGQDLFATIADKLFAAIPKVEVHFVGVVSAAFGGEHIVDSLQRVGQGCFIVHGHKDNVLEYVHAADIVVSTSRSEAFPRTVAEYLAMGKPIISTRVAGADEMIIDKHNGFLIDIDDADALFESIQELISQPQTCKLFSNDAELTYERLYSASRQEERFIEIFNKIVRL